MNKILAIIPSRYPSVRFPGKPLVTIPKRNKSLVNCVWEQSQLVPSITKTVIATDDNKIIDHVKSFNGVSILTSDNLRTGSDRVAEAYQLLKSQGEEFDLVINLQGDLPFINPEFIDAAISEFLLKGKNSDAGTAAVRIKDYNEYLNPNTCKVVLSQSNRALYFSRAPIPYDRDSKEIPENVFQHLGLYIFRPEALLNFAKFPDTYLQKTENLEQLRLIENDLNIYVKTVDELDSFSGLEVNVPEDIDKISSFLNKK